VITVYLQGVLQRFIEFGGFERLPPEAMPETLGEWAEDVLIRRDAGLVTLVAFVPWAMEGALRIARDELATLVDREAAVSEAAGLGLLVIVLDRPLTSEEYDRWQGLAVRQGTVRVVPWVVDLARGRLFPHRGPSYGIDPDLAMLAAPEPVEHPPAPQPVRRPVPWATAGLLGVIVGVWLVVTLLGGSIHATEQTDVLIRWGAVVRPDLFLTGQFWRLLTAAFLHIGLPHLMVNGLSLWWVGGAVETLFGPWRMLYIFLVAAVFGSAASSLLGPPVMVGAGASGGLFGLLGAIIWYRLSSPLGERIPWRPLLTTLGINLLFGLLLYQNIDNWNHLGGLLGGFLAAVAVGVPVVQGLPAPRLRLPRPLQVAAVAVLLLLTGSLVTGWVQVPGPARDLAQAIVALNEGRPADAEPLLARVVRRQPNDPRIRYFLIWTYYELGRCREAQMQLDRFLELAPNSPMRAELQEVVGSCQGTDT